MNEFKLKSTGLEDIFVLNAESLYETEIARQCFNIIEHPVFAVNLKGKLTLVNQKACEVICLPENELLGMSFVDLLEDENQKELASSNFDKVISGQPVEKSENWFRFISKDGEIRILKVRTVLMFNEKSEMIGVLYSGKDITRLAGIQDEMRDLIAQYSMLVNNIPNVNLYLFNENLEYTFAAGAEMLSQGLSEKDFKGRSVYEVYSDDILNTILPSYKSALAGKSIKTEYRDKSKSYNIWVLPLKKDSGQVYGGMVITQNITESKKAAKSLNDAKRQAEEANRVKSDFLANISHEIRTPLNAIVGFSEQLMKTKLTKQQEGFADVVNKASEHLLALVNDILILSKIEAGKSQIDKESFRLRNIFELVYDTLKYRADEKELNFVYKISPQADGAFLGDPMRIRQVLMNLASNAIKFTETGYVEMLCYRDEKLPERIHFEVIDTGVGIPQEKIDEIFDQFKQVDSTITKKYGGTGLGLTICKNLVEAMGGEISVWSQTGIGSRFKFYLPLSVSPDMVPENEVESRGEFDNMILGLKVLLVDDDGVNRLLGKTVLENMQCEVDIAIDGREAMEKLGKEKYELVLLDIHMPDISGLEVAKHLRTELKDESTYVLAVTAAALKEEKSSFKTSGINDYLIKPYKEISLYNKVKHRFRKGGGGNPVQPEENKISGATGATDIYNKQALQEITRNNEELIRQTLVTFIENAAEGLQEMRHLAEDQQWQELGEIVHRLLPSFRHLEVRPVLGDMEKIKSLIIEDQDYQTAATMTETLFEKMEHVITAIRSEEKL